MAKDQNKRIKPNILKQDKEVVAGIAGLSPVYAPANTNYSLTNLQAGQAAMVSAQNTEVQKKGDWEAARDAANLKEWAFHNMILEAKKQVGAQYGSDSDQLQSIGLKKKSEYKKPARKPTKKPM
jgi:hypothetical protein